jgi:hypothetical protein
MNRYQAILEIFNIKAGPIMGIWSLVMIALSIYSTVAGKPIDGSVAAMYGTAVAVYAGSTTYRAIKQSAVTRTMEPGDV